MTWGFWSFPDKTPNFGGFLVQMTVFALQSDMGILKIRIIMPGDKFSLKGNVIGMTIVQIYGRPLSSYEDVLI